MKTLFILATGMCCLAASACSDREPTPADTEMTQRSATAVGTDGVSIRYDALGSGETALVFVHGWSCDRSYWKEQYEFFSQDYTVLSVDLARHGESGGDRTDWTMAAFGADVAAVVEQEGVEQVVLIGHSMGGPVVLEAARLLSCRVRAVIGVDTLKRPGPAVPAEQAAALWSNIAADFSTQTENMVRARMFLPESDSVLVSKIAQDMGAAPENIAMAAAIGMTTYDTLDGLGATSDVPLILLNAASSPTDIEKLTEVRPNTSVQFIENAGHFPMLERPDEFNTLLLSTLDALP